MGYRLPFQTLQDNYKQLKKEQKSQFLPPATGCSADVASPDVSPPDGLLGGGAPGAPESSGAAPPGPAG